MAKAVGNYANSQLIKMEALKAGYVEGIALDHNGYVSEGSGENLFLVKGGVLYTPPLVASVLAGITRDSIVQLAKGLEIPVVEQMLPREMLYVRRRGVPDRHRGRGHAPSLHRQDHRSAPGAADR